MDVGIAEHDEVSFERPLEGIVVVVAAVDYFDAVYEFFVVDFCVDVEPDLFAVLCLPVGVVSEGDGALYFGDSESHYYFVVGFVFAVGGGFALGVDCVEVSYEDGVEMAGRCASCDFDGFYEEDVFCF